MSIELLQTLSLISFVLAAVLLVVAIIIFFALDLKNIIGDLTGANARKAIENIRKENSDDSKGKDFSKHNNKLTDKIGERPKDSTKLAGLNMKTAKISTMQLTPEQMEMMEDGKNVNETTLLNAAQVGETTLLDSVQTGETTLLNAGQAGETVLLNAAQAGETTLLNINNEVSKTTPLTPDMTVVNRDTTVLTPNMANDEVYNSFNVEVEFGFQESKEIIE